MFQKACVSSSLSLFLFLLYFCLHADGWSGNGDPNAGPLIPKNKRETIASSEYGEISVARVSDDASGYHLEFFTLEPNSLFLPVLLHTDMVFYVHTGSGKLNWIVQEENKPRMTALRRGDVYRLKPGTVFYLRSNLEAEREKLRIYAIFVDSEDVDLDEISSVGAYSSISDLVRGFDKKVLQAAFKVSDELIEALTNTTKSPAIVHDVAAQKNQWAWETRFLKAFFVGSQDQDMYDLENKKKADKAFNIRDAHPDVQNCNGRALTVTNKDMKVLKGSNIGIFMVNLTKGSMMGPHWNPMATEIAVVLEGEGMVRVVCSRNNTKQKKPSSSNSSSSKFKCENKRFRVEEGDVFVVPRFHPMAQMSFNNGSLVFMGFSTASKLNHPQFLAGERSVLRTLDKNVLAAAFNVSNTTMDQFLTPQTESVILDCTSCAEEEARMMEEEIEKKKQEEEEARKREEEEARKREEEEARKKKEEEEEEKKKEEEEKKKKEEEEEARKREEEEAARKKEEEEEARKREEEEAARKKEEEEEARKREEEEEEAKEEDMRREAAAEREQEEAMREEAERQKREREEEETKEEDRRREEAAEREEEEAMRGEKERQEREKEEVKYEIGGGGEGKRAEY